MSAVMAALQVWGRPPGLRGPSRTRSWASEDLPWQELLDFCDRSSLTLIFGAVADDALPDWVRARIARNLVENTERLERARALQHQVSEWLTAAGIPYIFLKGTTQSPHFVSDPRLR